MTEIDAYQEYIRCKHNAFCKAVIRYAAIGKIIRLRQKWEREAVSHSGASRGLL